MLRKIKNSSYLIAINLSLTFLISCKQNKVVENEESKEVSSTSKDNPKLENIEDPLKILREKEQPSKSNDSNIVSIEPRPDLMPNYFDTSKFHRYNDLVLRKTTKALYYAKIGDYFYKEMYPGIIKKVRKKNNRTEELSFLKSNTSGRIDTLKLVTPEDHNPFRKRKGEIRYEYPSFELYDQIAENQMPKYINREPDYFLTQYYVSILLRGHVSIDYTFTPISDNNMLPWEFHSIIFNKEGSIIGTIKDDHHIHVGAISEDGNYAIYKYGFNGNNPYETAKHGEYRIVDLRSNQLIKKIIPEKGFEVNIIFNEKNGIIRLSYNDYLNRNTPNEHVFLDFIDLENRIRYTRKVLKTNLFENDLDILKTRMRSELVNKYEFEITKY